MQVQADLDTEIANFINNGGSIEKCPPGWASRIPCQDDLDGGPLKKSIRQWARMVFGRSDGFGSTERVRRLGRGPKRVFPLDATGAPESRAGDTCWCDECISRLFRLEAFERVELDVCAECSLPEPLDIMDAHGEIEVSGKFIRESLLAEQRWGIPLHNSVADLRDAIAQTKRRGG